MSVSLFFLTALSQCFRTASIALLDLARLLFLAVRPRAALSFFAAAAAHALSPS